MKAGKSGWAPSSTEGARFYTKVKTITARWPEGSVEDSAFVIPTMK